MAYFQSANSLMYVQKEVMSRTTAFNAGEIPASDANGNFVSTGKKISDISKFYLSFNKTLVNSDDEILLNQAGGESILLPQSANLGILLVTVDSGDFVGINDTIDFEVRTIAPVNSGGYPANLTSADGTIIGSFTITSAGYAGVRYQRVFAIALNVPVTQYNLIFINTKNLSGAVILNNILVQLEMNL